MAVRPFYLSADVEGRRTPLAGGPARRDGSMTVEITQRNAGEIETAFKIRSYREGDVMSMIVQELVWQHIRLLTNK